MTLFENIDFFFDTHYDSINIYDIIEKRDIDNKYWEGDYIKYDNKLKDIK